MSASELVMLLNGICIGAVGATFIGDWLDRRNDRD